MLLSVFSKQLNNNTAMLTTEQSYIVALHGLVYVKFTQRMFVVINSMLTILSLLYI